MSDLAPAMQPPPAAVRGFPPGAFLIGAQKSATTSFADLLAQHPAIALATPKEPNFFTGNQDQGLDWYAARFPRGHDGVLLDASTSYTQCPFPEACHADDPLVGVPERIRGLRPDARLIYLLRDPVERAYSAYWHGVRRGWEDRPLATAMDARSDYLAASSYAYQLEPYLRLFAPEQLMIVRLSAFVQRRQEVLERCLGFLGLPADGFRFALDAARNRSFTYNRTGTLLRRAVGGERRLKQLSLALRRVIPDRLQHRLAGLLTDPIPPLDDATRALIRDRLDPSLVEIVPRPGLVIVD
jgi:hypothetical protein